MALRAFHANPGIGGFGGEGVPNESWRKTTPIRRDTHDGHHHDDNNDLDNDGGDDESENLPVVDEKETITMRRNGRGTSTRTVTSSQENVPAEIVMGRRRRGRGVHGSDTSQLENHHGNGDAMCQIVKELVDNAIDACRPSKHLSLGSTSLTSKGRKMRIKVEIRPFGGGTQDDTENDIKELLEVKVTDNGCGMENIQDCVDVFQSSKAQSTEDQTSGRYGIGLTLALLHSQRLVPTFCSTVTSTTFMSPVRTQAHFKVDTKRDGVICKKEEEIEKVDSTESGTCVRVFVPGGQSAKMAWKRLVDYFHRFRLCSENEFGIDVLAPSLSNEPLHIRPDHGGRNLGPALTSRHDPNKKPWEDVMNQGATTYDRNRTLREKKKCKSVAEAEAGRLALYRAAKAYTNDSSLHLKNVARFVQTIHTATVNHPENQSAPLKSQLEVNMVVYTGVKDGDRASGTNSEEGAQVQLIRMVNDVPILDGAEAHACGLVHGLAKCKAVWASFGLQVGTSSGSSSSAVATPCFELRDTNQVLPFLQWNNQHRLLDIRTINQDIVEDRDVAEQDRKRGRNGGSSNGGLLPAHIRFGRLLVVVRIRAAPTALPLPTLSKGRLPLNHGPIDNALQLAIEGCLKSLQVTNPDLLLSPSQLRSIERDVRYIPAISSAVSRIVLRSNNQSFRSKVLALAQVPVDGIGKGSSEVIASHRDDCIKDRSEDSDRNDKVDEGDLSRAFEQRLRLSIQIEENAKIKHFKKPRKNQDKEQDYGDVTAERFRDDRSKSAAQSVASSASPFTPRNPPTDLKSIALSASSEAPTLPSVDGLLPLSNGNERKAELEKQLAIPTPTTEMSIKEVHIHHYESTDTYRDHGEEQDFVDEWL